MDIVRHDTSKRNQPERYTEPDDEERSSPEAALLRDPDVLAVMVIRHDESVVTSRRA